MAFDVSTCAVSGLFSIGEDFDDEDLLGSDWAVGSSSTPAVPPFAVASCSLRASSVSLRGPETNRLQPAARRHGAASQSESTHTAAGPTAPALALRRPSSSSSSSSAWPPPPTTDASRPNLPQDDFDDWDVDLADLDECDRQSAPPPARGPPAPSCKTLRPPNCGGVQAHPDRPPRDFGATFVPTPPPRASSAPLLRSPNPRPARPSPAPPPSPGVFPGLTASSPGPSPISRTIATPRRSWATPPGPSPRGHGLFESVSPAPSSSPSLSPRPPRHTPVFTNRLVQLVSASNKPPSKRPRSEAHRPRTRRFPGPAGFLPQQPQGQNLDDIVVSVPQTPAHGAVARSPSQGSSSQTDEDEFGAGGWAAMKAEMGLDERNPSCFLHSYSVVMVLRKAALKQLAKNKVPNMAVLLKSIIHTHADAKAVFRDPTGEIQGTVHRRLLEERAEELQVGSVLLLKQVGVFSPSHRNHYLNVTPNNLLRIYAPDGAAPSSSARLPPLLLEPMSQAGSPPAALQGTVSRMQLVFDEEEEEDDEEGGEHPKAPRDARAGSPAPLDAGWDADDDLDELLGELPEESCSL